MSAAESPPPVRTAEARALFSDLTAAKALVLAVSGGPDSTALLVLAARWRASRPRGPELVAVTVDHGLRPEARQEAAMVGRLARKLGVRHVTLRWKGSKPAAGLQQAAREARYRLLAQAARRAGARHVLTAHTLDDQAETVLFRLARGSGLAGLAGMSRTAALPVPEEQEIALVRPLLGIPKARLIATLNAAGIPFVIDPSNADPRFARSRLRALLPALQEEGLDSRRLAQLAWRMRRADAALEAAVDAARKSVTIGGWPQSGPIRLDAGDLARVPEEIRLRLLRRAVRARQQEGTVELGKLEDLLAGLDQAMATRTEFRRTLAGAMVTLLDDQVVIEAAPPRESRPAKRPLTTPARPRRRTGVRR